MQHLFQNFQNNLIEQKQPNQPGKKSASPYSLSIIYLNALAVTGIYSWLTIWIRAM